MIGINSPIFFNQFQDYHYILAHITTDIHNDYFVLSRKLSIKFSLKEVRELYNIICKNHLVKCLKFKRLEFKEANSQVPK